MKILKRFRTCSKCKKRKLSHQFYAHSAKRGDGTHYYQSWCKECAKANSLAHSRKNPQAQRQAYLRRKGMEVTQAQLAEFVQSRGSTCEICGVTPVKLCVDHDHEVLILRGVLCGSCNAGLGSFKDDIDILLSAIKYLKQHKQAWICNAQRVL